MAGMPSLDGLIIVVNDWLGWVQIVALIGVTIYCSFRTKFTQLRLVPEMVSVILKGTAEEVGGDRDDAIGTGFAHPESTPAGHQWHTGGRRQQAESVPSPVRFPRSTFTEGAPARWIYSRAPLTASTLSRPTFS